MSSPTTPSTTQQTWPLAGLDEALLIAAVYVVIVFGGTVRAVPQPRLASTHSHTH